MRSQWTEWLNSMRHTWRVPDGTAHVIYPVFDDYIVKHDDDTWSPRQFTYVEMPDDPGIPYFVMECEYVGRDLVPRIVALQVIQRDPQREVRSVDLRRIRPEEVVEDAWLKIARQPATVRNETSNSPQEGPEPSAPVDLRKTFRGLRARNRRRVTDQVLEQVAAIYLASEAQGAPTKAVKEHFGLAPSTASLYVKRAREAGFLPQRPQER